MLSREPAWELVHPVLVQDVDEVALLVVEGLLEVVQLDWLE